MKSLALGGAKRFVPSQPDEESNMVKTKLATLARISPALALFSCAAPKAVVVREAAAAPKKEEPAQAPAPQPAVATQPNDGIRLPDMLTMPGDGEFRATSNDSQKPAAEPGAVISRPPTDPPSRPKPKDKEKPAGGQ